MGRVNKTHRLRVCYHAYLNSTTPRKPPECLSTPSTPGHTLPCAGPLDIIPHVHPDHNPLRLHSGLLSRKPIRYVPNIGPAASWRGALPSVASDWDGRDVAVVLGLLSFIRFGYSISFFVFLGLSLLSSHALLISVEAPVFNLYISMVFFRIFVIGLEY